jgi:hypothetical protein
MPLAASVTVKKRFKFGNGWGVVADVAMDNSYPTNGEALTPQQFGLNNLDFVLPSPASGYLFQYDHTNNKLKAFTPTNAQTAHTHLQQIQTGATAAADSVSGALVKNNAGAETAFRAMGTGVSTTYEIGPTQTGGAVSAAAAAEVANGADLSSVSVRVLAVGI